MLQNKFEYWMMDFITGLPDINGFNVLLVCVDKFGKPCRLFSCRAGKNELSTLAIAKLFFEHVVCLYGTPRVMLHESDPRFTTTFWKELRRILECKIVFSSTFYPQTDSQMERHNRTIEQLLQALGHENGLNWLEAVPLVEMTLNNAVNNSACMLLDFILYG